MLNYVTWRRVFWYICTNVSTVCNSHISFCGLRTSAASPIETMMRVYQATRRHVTAMMQCCVDTQMLHVSVSPQTRRFLPSTATGCMASSDTRPPVLATGHAGTEQPRNSCASAGCSTTRTHTPVTGLTTWRAARSTVSSLAWPESYRSVVKEHKLWE
jgi:hypothetical protein